MKLIRSPARLLALPLLLLASFLFMSSSAPDSSLPGFWDAVPHGELAEKITSAMTDEELLAQVFMFGWAGSDPTPLVVDWVGRHSLGSIKVFGWNTDNTAKVAESVCLLQGEAMRGRFRIPLFVATDQEGGWIRHIKGRTSQTPGNLAIGASGLPSDSWYSGYYISRELAALGINLNFAPTVDLYTDHDSTVIGPRSFGEDPEAAGILGSAFVSGSRAAGVLTTAKHFPGHGDTGLDSHGRLPEIGISRKTLYSRELVPFRSLIEAGVPAVMSGHLGFPRITGNGVPATFSSLFLRDILRGELGFDGLVITDDIMMNGATEYAGSVSTAVQMASSAGNDIVESSTTPFSHDAFWTATLARMKRSADFRERVRESCERVIRVKLAYFKGDNPVPILPDVSRVDERVPDPEGERFFLSQAARSVTLIRGELPAVAGGGKSVLIAAAYPEFREAGKRRFPEAEAVGINDNLYRLARQSDTIIYCLSDKEDIQVLRNLRGLSRRIIVVSILSPVLLAEVLWVESALAVYSYSPHSFTAAFGALAGDYRPGGVLPLKGLE